MLRYISDVDAIFYYYKGDSMCSRGGNAVGFAVINLALHILSLAGGLLGGLGMLGSMWIALGLWAVLYVLSLALFLAYLYYMDTVRRRHRK